MEAVPWKFERHDLAQGKSIANIDMHVFSNEGDGTKSHKHIHKHIQIGLHLYWNIYVIASKTTDTSNVFAVVPALRSSATFQGRKTLLPTTPLKHSWETLRYMYTCAERYVNMYIFMCLGLGLGLCLHVHVYAYMHICIQSDLYIYIYMYVHELMQVYIYIHICVYA